MFRAIFVLLVTMTTALSGGASAQDTTLVRVATGNVTGAYFPVGVALCRLVNETRREHGIRCAAGTSDGSIANIELLRGGGTELAIIQSDVQSSAVTGGGVEALPGLRAILSLHPEPLTIVARSDAGISNLADLVGKRLSIGNPGSGHRALWDQVMAASGWTAESFTETLELAPLDQARALCEGDIDAFVMAVGHPALTVQEATLTCESVLIPATGAAVDNLVAQADFYFAAEIPGGLYRNNPAPTPTFGVGATLVATADVPEDVVYTIVSHIIGALGDLRALDSVLASLDAQTMVSTGLTAPLHPGAERYYREQGLIQ